MQSVAPSRKPIRACAGAGGGHQLRPAIRRTIDWGEADLGVTIAHLHVDQSRIARDALQANQFA